MWLSFAGYHFLPLPCFAGNYIFPRYPCQLSVGTLSQQEALVEDGGGLE